MIKEMEQLRAVSVVIRLGGGDYSRDNFARVLLGHYSKERTAEFLKVLKKFYIINKNKNRSLRDIRKMLLKDFPEDTMSIRTILSVMKS